MKSFYTLIVLSILTINVAFAQNYQSGIITKNDKKTIEGRVSIDNNSKNILFKKNNKVKTYDFDFINSITIDKENYSKITFNNEVFFAKQLESGKATIYNLSNNNFLIIKDNNEGKFFNTLDDENQIPGILSLLFNDCNTVRDKINKTEDFSGKMLTSITKNYNNCDYNNYSPTEKEIDKANSYNTDFFRFYTGLQLGFNNTTVNNFDSNNSIGVGVGLGLMASPSFMGNLKGNLYFDFDFAMVFTGSNDYANGPAALNYKVNTFRFSLGMEYIFNKEGEFSPFLGIGYGYIADYYDGALGTIRFKDNKQNYYFIPKIGVLYNLKEGKRIGLTISYISEYENDLSFIYGDDVTFYPLAIKNSSFNLGLNYYF